MKRQKFPEITIKGFQYEIVIETKKSKVSICDKCEFGLNLCVQLYGCLKECPCYFMVSDGYRGSSFLRAKKAGQ